MSARASKTPAPKTNESKPAPPQPTTLTLSAALSNFLGSDRVNKNAEGLCKYDSLSKHFKDYCTKNSITISDATLSVDALRDHAGLDIEKDTYKSYPGPNGSIQKSTWVKGITLVADDLFGAQLAVLCEFLNPTRQVFKYDTTLYMKYTDFMKCLDAFCLQKRVPGFKPSARLLKEVCVRYNMALESNGVREGVKGKWLLGVNF